MLAALDEHFGEQARWTKPQGGMFVWATLDERIDTTDLLAQARENEGVAFVPGRAAYMDGRRGSSSMRLNFAGVPDDDIREGIRRIGKVVREQLGLYGTLTGSAPAARAQAPAPASEQAPALADVVELPRRDREGAARKSTDR
jgi:2-aminoadipate transaminase